MVVGYHHFRNPYFEHSTTISGKKGKPTSHPNCVPFKQMAMFPCLDVSLTPPKQKSGFKHSVGFQVFSGTRI